MANAMSPAATKANSSQWIMSAAFTLECDACGEVTRGTSTSPSAVTGQWRCSRHSTMQAARLRNG